MNYDDAKTITKSLNGDATITISVNDLKHIIEEAEKQFVVYAHGDNQRESRKRYLYEKLDGEFYLMLQETTLFDLVMSNNVSAKLLTVIAKYEESIGNNRNAFESVCDPNYDHKCQIAGLGPKLSHQLGCIALGRGRSGVIRFRDIWS